MTEPTRQVLHALLADPTREHYGLELSKASGISHGTMYGILVRLESWGWLSNRLEHATDRATPPRRYYRLTDDGVEQAPRAIARADTSRRRTTLRTAPGGVA